MYEDDFFASKRLCRPHELVQLVAGTHRFALPVSKMTLKTWRRMEGGREAASE